MPNLITKVSGKLIKDYAVTHKFCNFSSSGCSLEGKFGSLTLDFSSLGAVKNCHINFKRRSGNGLIAITANGESKNYTIVSKFSENIVVNLESSKIISIIRPLSGIGHVDLTSISLLSDVEPRVIDFPDLRGELNKCQQTSIRSVNNRFFASDKSKLISNTNIEVETNPPNLFKQNGNIVSFGGLCEITGLKLTDTNIKDITLNENIHRSDNVLVLESKHIPFSLDFSIDKTITHQNAVVDDRGAVLNSDSVFKVSLSGLNVNSYYSINFEVFNITGDGKFNISISNTNLNTSTYYVQSKEKISIPFCTNKAGIFNLEINRADSDGTLLIPSLNVMRSDRMRAQKTPNNYLSLHVARSRGFFLENDADHYRKDILDFSRIQGEFYDYAVNKDIVLNLKPATYHMSSWVAKFSNLFSGVSVDNPLITGVNSQVSNQESSILCTDIYNLFSFKKILLEEFHEDLKQVQLDVLKDCKIVFCTSLTNAQYLRNSGVNRVLYVPKFWAYKKPSERIINKPYDLFFARSLTNAEMLCQNYPKNRKLVLVGYRGKDLGIETYSESIPYSDLLSLIYYADNVIDLPKNMHYYSGVLDFCMIAKKNIVSNNHWLSVSKPNISLVKTKMQNGVLYPDFNAVIMGLKNEVQKPNLDMESYNQNIKSTLMLLQEG